MYPQSQNVIFEIHRTLITHNDIMTYDAPDITQIVVLQFECLCRLLSFMGSVLITRSLLDILFLHHHPFLHAFAQISWSNTPALQTAECIQCNSLLTFCEKISCSVVHCRMPSRFSSFLNITSLIGQNSTVIHYTSNCFHMQVLLRTAVSCQ
jgi:hypothetical protein